jgi:two-component system NarL family sensor kinase
LVAVPVQVGHNQAMARARLWRPWRSGRRLSGSQPSVSVARPLMVFATASLAAIVVLGLAATAVMRRTARDEGIREAKVATRLAGEGIVEPALGSALLRGDPTARSRLDRVVRRTVLRDPIVRVKVWTLDGRIVYSDEPRLVGRRFELSPAERTAVRTRTIDAEVSDVTRPENRHEQRFGKLLEVYLPIEAPDGAALLFEDYIRYGVVTQSEQRQLARFVPALIGALLLLWLVQLPLAASIARRLRQRQREREALLEHAIDSSNTERRRIAQYLHDGVVQGLSGVSYSLAATATRLERDGREPAWRAVRDATAATRRAIGELRALLVGIYPGSARRSGLASALSDLAAPLTARDIDVDVDVPADLDLQPAAEDTLFRGAQEALRNIAKHAAPHHVKVHVGVSDGWASLTVSDDGAGFSQDERPRSGGRHFGLRLLDDLVAERGGRLEVSSAAGQGTRLTIEVPIG